MSTQEQSTGNLELFETEFIQEFQKINITAIADYITGKNQSLIITGDSNGIIRVYKRQGSKLTEEHQLQKGKTKIDKLIVNSSLKVLYILTGGILFIHELPNLNDHTPHESDGEYKYLRDIAKIVENENEKNKNELMIITKKKKILFFYYNADNQRLLQKEYKDKDGKNLEIILKDIPSKIRWHGNYICYYLKNISKLVFISIETNINTNVSQLKENSQDIPIEEIAYIQSNWANVYTGGICVFLDKDGNPSSKSPITFDQSDPMIELGIFNDLYIISLNEKSIGIYDFQEGQCVQELTTDTSQTSNKKFLAKGQKGIFVVSLVKVDEKNGKDVYSSNLWELREFSFEEQIKFSLKHDQIEKAFGILNNKLEYNMEKFEFLESFYCDCGWNCFNKRNQKGFEDAEKYFSLCNFNPFELIYHFIKLLNIKPIHTGYDDIYKLPKEIQDLQIFGNIEKDENIKIALKMLINILSSKKRFLLNKYNILNSKKNTDKWDIIDNAQKIEINFESSQNCGINLKDVEPKIVNLKQVINIINEVLVKGMVLLKMNLDEIENIIENDIFDTEFPESFFEKLKDNNFKSDMTLVFINKKKEKYIEAFDILKKYIDNKNQKEENEYSKQILQKILLSFGKNINYTDEFEHGLRILLKDNDKPAFEIVLSNELISIDNFIKILDDIDKDNPESNKKEFFLELLCEDQKYSNYSNEKYQTSYMELKLNKIFDLHKKELLPPSKIKEQKKELKDILNKYKEFQDLFTKFTKYNKSHLLALIEDSWMYDLILFLYTDLQKYTEAIQKYIELVKSEDKTFENIRKFCQKNYCNDPDIFHYIKK